MTVDYLSPSIKWLAELTVPKRCLGCQSFKIHEKHPYFCPKCFHSLPIRRIFECIGCKQSVSLGQTCILCIKTNQIDQLFVVSDYKNRLVSSSLKTYKYRFIHDLGISLTLLTNRYIKYLANQRHYSIFKNNPLVIPVPLTKYRCNWRGFNQAEIIAQNVAQRFQMTYSPYVLIKTKESVPQAELENREERLANAINLFATNPNIQITDRDILLIDDVCTTGATLNACAQALKQKGAAKVAALVIARG